jgi:hypothetical protein
MAEMVQGHIFLGISRVMAVQEVLVVFLVVQVVQVVEHREVLPQIVMVQPEAAASLEAMGIVMGVLEEVVLMAAAEVPAAAIVLTVHEVDRLVVVAEESEAVLMVLSHLQRTLEAAVEAAAVMHHRFILQVKFPLELF